MSTKKKLPKAKYQGEIDLNGFKISCAVLEDGRRVFSERSLATAFGIKGGGAYWQLKKNAKNEGAILPEYLSAKYLNSYISNDLREKFDSAVIYESMNGAESRGVDVTVLPDICDVYVTAKNNGVAHKNFVNVANNAYTMIKVFAKVGIIALVDEATGYEKAKESDALQQFLQKFLQEERGIYVPTYPPDFFEAIFKMKGWTWKQASTKKPQVVGHYINNYVYSRLAPKILDELRALNPKDEKGNRKGKHPQWIDPKFGHPMLIEHLKILTAFAKGSGYNWNNWTRLIERTFPKFNSDGSAVQQIPFND